MFKMHCLSEPTLSLLTLLSVQPQPDCTQCFYVSHDKPHLDIYTKDYHVGAEKILNTLEKQAPHQHKSYLQENVFMFKSPIANI
jgi:hypothetical protein